MPFKTVWMFRGKTGKSGKEQLLRNLPALNKSYRQPPAYHGEELFEKIRKASRMGEMSISVSSTHVAERNACYEQHNKYTEEIENFSEDGRVLTIYFAKKGMCDSTVFWFPQKGKKARHVFYVM